MSVIKVPEADAAGWTCDGCGKEMVSKPVELDYLGSRFHVELPVCPDCNMVLITEQLALGKMQQVEQLLEDK